MDWKETGQFTCSPRLTLEAGRVGGCSRARLGGQRSWFSAQGSVTRAGDCQPCLCVPLTPALSEAAGVVGPVWLPAVLGAETAVCHLAAGSAGSWEGPAGRPSVRPLPGLLSVCELFY